MSSKEMGSLDTKAVPHFTLPNSSVKPTSPTPMNYNNVVRHNNIRQTVGQSNSVNNSLKKRKEVGVKSQKRPIVIDGCNVAYHHGRHDMFSAQGLKVMYDEFISRGWQSSEIIIFVKPSRMTDVDR